MSTKVPVPMVIFTSPRSKQHSPNMAACWSAIYGKKGDGENELVVVKTKTRQRPISETQERCETTVSGEVQSMCDWKMTTCHFKLQTFITSRRAYLDREIFFKLLSMCYVFPATQQLCLISLLQHNGSDELRQAGIHVISVDSVCFVLFFLQSLPTLITYQ